MANERLWTKERITYFWNKIKNLVSTTASGKVDKVNGKGLSTNDYTDNDQTAVQTTLPNRIAAIENAKGANGGYAELDSAGKVPSSQLPGFVDDVLEYASLGDFPLTGESGKIYIALDTNKTYRWSGSAYVEISESLALGETSATAYRGDRGKEAYDHASDANKIASAQTAGFYKIGITSEGHVASVAAVTKSDITGLGIPAQDTTYSAMTGATSSASGASGLVPQPSAGDEEKVLYGDGTWKTPAPEVDDMTGATSSSAGVHGLVPAPSAGDEEKVLYGDGTWKTPSGGNDMAGATSSSAGVHGLAPAPAAGQQSYVLTGDGTWKPAPGAKIQTIEVTVTNTSGAYDHTFEDDRVGADMKAILLEINNPYVFGDEIIATPGDGTIRLQCSDVCGTATVKISVIKVVMDQETVTSTEFTILNNRLSAIENVYSDFSITITPSDWTLSNGVYEYTWTNAKVTAKAAVEVKALDGAEESGIEDFDAVKVTGGVKFTAASLPTGNLPVWIRVMAVKATDVQAITGEDVATDVIDGAVNVDEALGVLGGRTVLTEIGEITGNGSLVIQNLQQYRFLFANFHDTTNRGFCWLNVDFYLDNYNIMKNNTLWFVFDYGGYNWINYNIVEEDGVNKLKYNASSFSLNSGWTIKVWGIKK